MINQEELAVCRRRGHEPHLLTEHWSQCKWCNMWLRELRTIEEREDEPPLDQQDPIGRLRRERPQEGN